MGGGKTTFVKGLAKGLGSKDSVASPTFTLNKIYSGKNKLAVHHYDFYRLSEAGIMSDELSESLHDPKVITVVEWSDIVKDVLPADRIKIEIRPAADNPDERILIFTYPESKQSLIKKLETCRVDIKP